MAVETRNLVMLDLAEANRLSEFDAEVVSQAIKFINEAARELALQWNGTINIPLSIEDSMLVVFGSASLAVEMICALNRTLQSVPWYPAKHKCRSAVVSGDVDLSEEAEDQPILHTLYSLKENCRPGQILISEATHALARQLLSRDIAFLNLGVHHLDDAQRAQTLFQLLHPDLPDLFQPLPTLLTVASNLPRGLTPFIGRKQEVNEIREQFYLSRVVALSGFSGIGKSRLAIKVAQEMLEDHYDGACYADLSGFTTREQIFELLAIGLGICGTDITSVEISVLQRLRTSETLVIFDNADSALHELPSVTEKLINMCPHLQILVSSTKPMRLVGVQPYTVLPMHLPENEALSLESLETVDSVALFVNRADIASGNFLLTSDNASKVAHLCRRLEGIPLAIELVASMLARRPLEQLVSALEANMDPRKPATWTVGAKTLEQAMKWSHEVLDTNEKKMFRRLAVFNGEFTPEAAINVASSDLSEKIAREALESLRIQGFFSTIRLGGTSYYRMMETVRTYGTRQLIQNNLIEECKERHATWYTARAVANACELASGDQSQAITEFDRTYRNFRAALQWICGSLADSRGPTIICALERYWLLRCRFGEGLAWAEQGLRENKQLTMDQKGSLHLSSAAFASAMNDYERAEKHLKIARAVGKRNHLPLLLCRANALSGSNSLYAGDVRMGRMRLQEALAFASISDDKECLADCLHRLGELLVDLGEFGEAETLLNRSVQLNEQLKRKLDIGSNYWVLGRMERLQGNSEGSSGYLEQAFSLYNGLGDYKNIASALREYAFLRVDLGAYHSAATIFGAENSLRRRVGASIPFAYRAEAEKKLSASRIALGNRFHQEFSQGAEMTIQQIADFVLCKI